MNGSNGPVRRLLAGVLAALATAAYLAPPVKADLRSPQATAGQPPRSPELNGTRLYIAAARDSRLFTLCPPPGWPPKAKSGVPQPNVDGVILTRLQMGTWDSEVVTVRETGEHAELPAPPGGETTSDPAVRPVHLDEALVSWDEDTAAAIAREVAKRGAFRVVESAIDADYVLLVEAQHMTEARFAPRTGASSSSVTRVGGDREANFLEALFGVVVPADEYRTHGADVPALLPVSLWDGMAFARGAGGRSPASPEFLVQQMIARTRRPRRFPLLCAASRPATGQEGREPIRILHMGAIGAADDVRGSRPADRPTSTPTFHSEVTYVSVPVVVTDTGGRAVTGLTDADFWLFEDNAAQKIERLLPMTAAVNLALVVDTSSSMRLEWSQIRTALLTFFETLRPDDRVLLASFDNRVLVDAEYTSDRSLLRRAVSQMDRRQGTRLYDAVALLATRRMQGIPDRTAIVLLTDGVDTRSRLANGETTKAFVSESHIPVYVIQYDTRRDDYSLPVQTRDMVPTVVMPEGAGDNTQLFLRADAYLAALRDLSGGRLFRAASVQNLSVAFAQVAKDLGEQYTLGYYPTNQARDGTYRSLRIEVNRPDVQVRARAGYRAPSKTPAAR